MRIPIVYYIMILYRHNATSEYNHLHSLYSIHNVAGGMTVCRNTMVDRVNHDGPGVENFHLLYDVSTQLGLPQV